MVSRDAARRRPARPALSRRDFLATLAAAAAVAAARPTTRARAAAAPGEGAPPKETGLASEGLLAGQPGFQPRTVMPLPYGELPGFLSAAQLTAHHGEYARAVSSLQAAEGELAARAGDDPARYAALRREQVRAANAVLLHELYFRSLARAKVAVPRYLEGHMREHMGSIERWAADFTRCALAARSWAVLVYDPYDDRWHDAAMDGDADGVWIGANPLVVCDVAEHAHDYARREEYVRKFLEHLDWNEVASRYRRVDRM